MRVWTLVPLALALQAQGPGREMARTGEFETRATVGGLLGEASAQTFEHILAPDQPIEWSVYVPESYDPAHPPGVLAFVSAQDSGKIPARWKPVMDDLNLIWMGANQSGNQVVTSLRMTYALLGPALALANYQVDQDRIYVSGFSGGGRVASLVATAYANLFKGAVYNCGANFWGKEKPARFEEIKTHHFVFITGTEDVNLQDTRSVYRAYRKAGVPNVKLMVIPMMAHENPSAAHYREAIEFLDSRRKGLPELERNRPRAAPR